MPNNSRCRISNKSQYQSAHGPHLRKPFRFTTAYLTVPQESKCRDFFTLFAAPVYHRSPLPIGEPSRCSTRIEMLPRFIHMKKKSKTCSCSWHFYCWVLSTSWALSCSCKIVMRSALECCKQAKFLLLHNDTGGLTPQRHLARPTILLAKISLAIEL